MQIFYNEKLLMFLSKHALATNYLSTFFVGNPINEIWI